MNDEILILDSDTSIVLPYFDTSPILNDSINLIFLSLFVIEKDPDVEEEIQITINPIDLNTKKVDDGLSTRVRVKKGEYVDFKLPKELFEKTIKNGQRFLIHLVTKNRRIIFQGANAIGTTHDPKLIINHDSSLEVRTDDIIKEYNYYNITNSQIIFGDNNTVSRDSISHPINEKDIPLWLKWVLAVVAILGFLFTVSKFSPNSL